MQHRPVTTLVLLGLLISGMGACEPEQESDSPVLRAAGHNERGELFLADTDDGPRLLEAVAGDAQLVITVYAKTHPPCRLDGPGVGELEERTSCTDADFELALALAFDEVEIVESEFRYARPMIGSYGPFLGYEEPAPEVPNSCVDECDALAEQCIRGGNVAEEDCYAEQQACIANCGIAP
jgi:hypothetical protein